MSVRERAVPGRSAGLRTRPGTHRSRWSLARQLVVLQVVLVVALLAGATALAGVDADREVQDQAGRRCLVVAATIADTPAVIDALATADPTAALQPMANRIQVDTGVDFVTIMNLQGIRYTHRDPAQIGKQFLGTIGPGLAGENLIETYTGTLGESIRAVVPIRDGAGGPVIALVAVGVTLDAVATETSSRIWVLVLGGGGVLALALLGTNLIGRRVDRLTHRLGPAELGLMYEHYDAVLRSVREGLVLLDRQGRVKLANDEAVRLLQLPAAATVPVPGGEPFIGDLGLPAELVRVLVSGEEVVDSMHLAGERVIVVGTRATTDTSGARLGTVVTVRDHTEMRELTNELGGAKDLAEALRSQAHESANRLHAVVGLIELGRPAEAVAFATEELRAAQILTDRVVGEVEEPVIAAVLLGKAQIAAERGIGFTITEDSALDAAALDDAEVPARDVVTVLGNLIDNAFEAVALENVAAPRQVWVTVRRLTVDRDGIWLQVADSGPGLPEGVAAQMFTRNFSTKRPDGAVHGHGLGLALVQQVVRRHRGTVEYTSRPVPGDGTEVIGTVFTVILGSDGRGSDVR
ncbi:sensor histidine kinase [Nakamurella silvestris]|nr:sensor histidine kinase [Nakamurella silvestris]